MVIFSALDEPRIKLQKVEPKIAEVNGVEVGNQWCEELEVVRREAKRLFEQRFKATHNLGVSLGLVEFRALPVEVSLSMVFTFFEEEVKDDIW